jgi:signal peptidase II
MKIPICIIGILALDQLSKLVVQRLDEPVAVIDGFFVLRVVRNPGGAFGIFQGSGELITGVTALVVVVILAFLLFAKMESLVMVGFAFIAGGALGNLIDRIRLGYVIDFLDIWWWPVFNFADVAIVVGTGVIILGLIKR